jgi:hypothetical protein
MGAKWYRDGKILGYETANNNLKICRVFLAYGNVMCIAMIYNWKFKILQCQILQFAVYLYSNSAHFITYIFMCVILYGFYSPEYIILKARTHDSTPHNKHRMAAWRDHSCGNRRMETCGAAQSTVQMAVECRVASAVTKLYVERLQTYCTGSRVCLLLQHIGQYVTSIFLLYST